MKEILNELLGSPNKSIEIKVKFFVEYVELIDDLDLIKLNLIKDNNIYKGIVMEKGLTFPIPKKDDIILAKKIYLKYNQQFQFQIYIEGNVTKEEDVINIQNVTKDFSFEENNIFNTLSEFKNIKLKNASSTIFIVEGKLGDYAEVKSLSDSKKYILEHSLMKYSGLKKKSFLWINFHEIENKKIMANILSTFEILNDEQMARILNLKYFDNLEIFKVIDINKDNIIVIDVFFNILNVNKNNEKLKGLNIELCTLIIISNFEKKDNEVKLFDESFIYKLKEEFHYLDININSIAILKLYILDFDQAKNKYDTFINCEDNKKVIITKKEEYLIITNAYPRLYEYFPCKIGMLNSKNEKIKPITFTIYVYNGLMNKINVFLTTICEKTYFYEYLYYNLTQPLKNIEKNIIVNDIKYEIKMFDNFSSENRKRICLLNIPYQDIKTFENELLYNSIQVSEIFLEDKSDVLSINDISCVEIKKPRPNSYFNEYYSDFGDIYDLMKECGINNRKNMIEVLNKKIKKFNDIEFEYDICDINLFDNIMTLSQFKTWIGLIISYYMSFFASKQLHFLNKIEYILSLILEENVNYYDFIRIFIFLIKEKIINNNKSNVELIFISRLDKLSPYLIAYQFNINQINNLKECDLLFQAYLQFDSFEAFNYLYKEKSYTFSLEMNFMIKHQLLSAYENFFIVKRKSSGEYAYIDYKTKITVINEASIFEDNKKDISAINEENEAKNCAIPLVINFSHEKGGHFKFLLKNDFDSSPKLYFKGLSLRIEAVNKNGIIDGETGNIIELFICDDKDIIDKLTTSFIYGALLESKYFNGNGNELKNAVLLIYESNLKKEKEKTKGNLLSKTKKNNKENSSVAKTKSGFPHYRLYGCFMLDENAFQKIIPKEKKEEMNKENYMEKVNKFKKMKEMYDKSKKLYEEKAKKK